jgi:glycosyltransferase involved in cell wall biosynthesis
MEDVTAAGVPRSSISIIPCGVDLAKFDEAREKADAGIAGRPPAIGIFGWIEPPKGLHVVIECIPYVRQAIADARFVFVGVPVTEDEHHYAVRLQNRVDALEQADAVTWLGFRDDVPSLMAGCDVIVQAATERETLGVVLLEAMAAGKPVISTRLGGPAELVRDGENGIAVPPNDPIAIANAIISLLRDEPRRTAMGLRGRALVEEAFTTELRATRTAELLRRAAETRSAVRLLGASVAAC